MTNSDGVNPGWRDLRVRRDEAADPATLLDHPMNSAVHMTDQEQAVESILDRFGWVADVIVNANTMQIVDGHLRCQIARGRGETVPVTYLDITEQEHVELLAVYDSTRKLALQDDGKYHELVAQFTDPSDAIRRMFDKLDTWNVPTNDPEPDVSDEPDVGDIVYGMVGWSETKVKATGEEIEALTRAHMDYRAENGGSDDGFVTWITQALLD